MTDKDELARRGVTVKPLEWELMGPRLWRSVDPLTGKKLFSYTPEGCDAPQADYEARVLSLLTIAPDDGGEWEIKGRLSGTGMRLIVDAAASAKNAGKPILERDVIIHVIKPDFTEDEAQAIAACVLEALRRGGHK
ncbi:MAG: hypothetical protein EBR82_50100 [Caulobacteraceae bacterium]|nr:hypothetical protein [Caulobacteraceae bacterium]